jgi:hypothetical protein
MTPVSSEELHDAGPPADDREQPVTTRVDGDTAGARVVRLQLDDPTSGPPDAPPQAAGQTACVRRPVSWLVTGVVAGALGVLGVQHVTDTRSAAAAQEGLQQLDVAGLQVAPSTTEAVVYRFQVENPARLPVRVVSATVGGREAVVVDPAAGDLSAWPETALTVALPGACAGALTEAGTALLVETVTGQRRVIPVGREALQAHDGTCTDAGSWRVALRGIRDFPR